MEFDTDAIAKEYTSKLLRFCKGRIVLEDDRWDIVQDVLLAFFKNKDGFIDKKHLNNWFYRVAENKISSFLRAKYKTMRFEIAEELAEDVPAAVDDDSRYLREAIKKLPKKQAQMLEMYYFENYATKEIAKRLNVTESTVWNSLKHARDNLKKMTNDD